MEIFGLGLAAYILTWPAIAVIFFLGVLFEHNQSHKTALLFGILAAVISFYYFDISIQNMLIGSVVYFILGFVWSFWRYKRELVTRIKFGLSLEYATPRNMVGDITLWVFLWPLSFIGNLAGDLIDAIQTFIKTYLISIYERIYRAALRDASNK